ncbi:MAG: thioredoxin family protein [Candidatus Rokubacteria bacterium]|nr:thioredoxin family protein [Candidatus Rokubacteria bacterium]
MGTVTYPNPDVQREIEQHFVPVQFNVVEQRPVMDQFNSSWTPTLIVQDSDGREYRRSLGYLDPARFLGEMSLARVAASVHRRKFAEAQTCAAEALARTKGDPAREPEAFYFAAIADYKVANDGDKLVAGWTRLLDQFPESDWSKKVAFIRK